MVDKECGSSLVLMTIFLIIREDRICREHYFAFFGESCCLFLVYFYSLLKCVLVIFLWQNIPLLQKWIYLAYVLYYIAFIIRKTKQQCGRSSALACHLLMTHNLINFVANGNLWLNKTYLYFNGRHLVQILNRFNTTLGAT